MAIQLPNPVAPATSAPHPTSMQVRRTYLTDYAMFYYDKASKSRPMRTEK